ncbi:hypothetical protein BV25DRAFT_1842985 [Artomyces pyxidatus]|uniref:Uncharacterized protein n=1 Tax=Artomyces pyxidatus TaxID=48021 RepID=A0ACB8SFW5_9AGAM|nr:hypothetical protein BV25DRAFT_1842985 [Artomyces pyxidatus]
MTTPRDSNNPTRTQSYFFRVKTARTAVMHFDPIRRALGIWYWPVDDSGERTPPAQLETYRHSHDMRGPYCLCPLTQPSLKTPSEAAIHIKIAGLDLTLIFRLERFPSFSSLSDGKGTSSGAIGRTCSENRRDLPSRASSGSDWRLSIMTAWASRLMAMMRAILNQIIGDSEGGESGGDDDDDDDEEGGNDDDEKDDDDEEGGNDDDEEEDDGEDDGVFL